MITEQEFRKKMRDTNIPESQWGPMRVAMDVATEPVTQVDETVSVGVRQLEDVKEAIAAHGTRFTEIHEKTKGVESKLTEYQDEIGKREADLDGRIKALEASTEKKRSMVFPDGESNEDAAARDVIEMHALPLMMLATCRRADRSTTFSPTYSGYLSEEFAALGAHFGLRPEALRAAAEQKMPSAAMAIPPRFHDRTMQAAADRAYQYMMTRAASTSVTGSGEEFMETVMSSQLFRRLRLENKIIANLNVIDMPRAKMDFPAEGADFTYYYVAENTSDTPNEMGKTTPGTENIEFAAKKAGAAGRFSYESVVNSIIPMAGYFHEKAVTGMNDFLEYAVMRGDRAATANANINKNDGTPTTTAGAASGYLVVNGIHKFCIDGITSGSTARQGTVSDMATFAEADISTLRTSAGKYGVDPANIMLVTTVGGYFKFFNATNFPSLVTIEKYGSAATILTGELARINGIPIIVSLPLTKTEDGEAGECITTSSTLKDHITLIHRPSYLVGFSPLNGASRVLIETDRNILTQMNDIVISVCLDLEQVHTHDATNGHYPAVLGYDID